MSGKLSGAVWEIELSGSKQQVMLALADHAHDDGTKCYPGIPYLAWKTGYSERHVKRLLRELEEDGIILPVAHEKGGRGHATEYEIHLEKGTRKPPYVKSDKPQRVTPPHKKSAVKGDIPTQRVTGQHKRVTPRHTKGDITGLKGDITVSPQPLEPSTEPSTEPEEESRGGNLSPDLAALPDDVTARCLLLLKDVKGFPREQAENALYLMELRDEFPKIDPVAVCRAYRIWMRDNPNKTKNYRSRLRKFFENQEQDRLAGRSGVGSQTKSNGRGAQNGADKQHPAGDGDDLNWLFGQPLPDRGSA